MKQSNFTGKLLGGNIDIIIYDITEQLAKPIFEDIYKEALRLEKIFNLYDKESELSRLNKTLGLKVSKELLFVIKKAIKYSNLTNGEYDITLGKNFLERKNNKPLSKLSCSYKDIKIKGNNILITNPEVIIDLGSIAKGYIVDCLVSFMKDKGILSGFIDARGDMKTFGKYSEEIFIQDPRDKNCQLFSIKLKNCSIATSGDYNQYHENFDNCHILNKKDIISVTVISKDLIDADVFASSVFLLDYNSRKRLINQNPSFKVMTIDKNNQQEFFNDFDTIKEIKGENI